MDLIHTQLPTFLTVQEVAVLFRVDNNTIRRMCGTGEISAFKFGKSYRILVKALMRTHPVSVEDIYSILDQTNNLPHI